MFKNQLCCTILLESKKHHHHHNATNVITIYYNIVAIIERIALFEYAAILTLFVKSLDISRKRKQVIVEALLYFLYKLLTIFYHCQWVWMLIVDVWSRIHVPRQRFRLIKPDHLLTQYSE